MFTDLNDYFGPKFKRTAAFVVMCSVLASSTATVNAMSRDYHVVDGSNVSYVTSLSNDTDKVLHKAGVTLNSDDSYVYDDQTKTITVLRAFDVTVKDHNGNYLSYRTNQGIVADALSHLNISLGSDETVSPSLATPLSAEMGTINVYHWNTVKVNIDGQIKDIRVATGTVLFQALNESGLGLTELDRISVEKGTIVSGDMEIDVNRVEVKDETVTEPIAYNTVSKKTSSLPLGKKVVETAGVNGERVVTKKVTLVDGKVEAEQILDSKVTKEASDAVVLEGTATASLESSSGGGSGAASGAPVDYSRLIQATCTAYTGGGTCSTGVPAARGNVAVNPSQIPYGTRMYICSPDGSVVYGYAIAADTGGAMMSGAAAVDLYYDTESECRAFGRRTMNVYVL